jgi:hypothetical protein
MRSEDPSMTVLSPTAVAVIRAALLAIFQQTGGDPDVEEDEPALAPDVRELECKARAALRLLDNATPPDREAAP